MISSKFLDISFCCSISHLDARFYETLLIYEEKHLLLSTHHQRPFECNQNSHVYNATPGFHREVDNIIMN